MTKGTYIWLGKPYGCLGVRCCARVVSERLTLLYRIVGAFPPLLHRDLLGVAAGRHDVGQPLALDLGHAAEGANGSAKAD